MVSLEDLNGYDASDFEQWFGARFHEHYGPDAEISYRAFDFGHLGIFHAESHLDAIEQLFDLLSSIAKRRVREALENLFRHAQPSTFPRDGMQDLIQLFGRLRAFSAVKAFAPVLVAGPWGELEPSLVYDALSVLFDLEQSKDTYNAMKDLISSSNFDSRYVFDAYTILFRTEPVKWAQDLGSLRQRFALVIAALEASADPEARAELAERQRELVVDLTDAVPLSRVASGLATLPLITQGSLVWFVRRLFGRSGPLVVVANGNRWHIEKREGGSHSEPLTPSLELRTILLSKGLTARAPATPPRPGLDSHLETGVAAAARRITRLRPRHEDFRREYVKYP